MASTDAAAQSVDAEKAAAMASTDADGQPVNADEQPLLPRSVCGTHDLSKAEQGKLKKHFEEDENIFTFSVLNVMATSFILGHAPALMWVVHIVKMLIYLPWRFFRFRAWKGELYMIEFCYFVSYYTTIGCILALLRTQFELGTQLEKFNTMLMRTGFAMATGTVAWSVFIFRNSLVFHDPDQLTTTFIHLSPALLYYTLRWGAGSGVGVIEQWWPGMFRMCPEEVQKLAVDPCLTKLWCDNCPATIWEMGGRPFLHYLVLWAVPYYVVMFILLPGYIARNGKDTLFIYSTQEADGTPKDCWLTRNVRRDLWPLGHMAQHGFLTLVAGAFSYLMWHSFWIHTLFMFILVFTCVKNGASYTFQVFAMRYADAKLKKHPSVFMPKSAGDDL